MKTKVAIAIVSSFSISQSLLLLAAPGDLDPTFAGTGKSRIGFGGGDAEPYAVTVQDDGKLIIAGFTSSYNGFTHDRGALVRYTTNGVLDQTFGDSGVVITKLSSTPDSDSPFEAFTAVGVQADGKIVAAGEADDSGTGTNDTFVLARYNPDGSLDPLFGQNGKVFTDFGGHSSEIYSMAIQRDGKIVVAGDYRYGPGKEQVHFALARYQTNGVLDSTFGSGGKVVTADFDGVPYGMALQTDGSIVTAGFRADSSNVADFAVLRYTTNGVLDPTFGGTGEVFTHIGDASAWDIGAGVAYQRGGGLYGSPDKIVVAGDVNNYYSFALARYNLDGSLDTTFGNGGIVTNALRPGSLEEHIAALLLQENITARGIIVHMMVAGTIQTASAIEFLVARYNGDGSPDTTFGPSGDGKVALSFGAIQWDEASALTFQAGKFVAAGSSYANFFINSDFAAARFNLDGSQDTNFGSGGVVTADIANLQAEANSVTIQPDGKIVVVGDASNDVEKVFAAARFNPDGTLDTTFGTNDGKVTTAFSDSNAVPEAVALQPDGKIVAAGYSYQGVGSIADDLVVAVRYNADGSLDPSFGSAGRAVPGVSGLAKAVAIQPDGRIVAAGYAYNGANDDFEALRFTTNGVLDTSFGGGAVTTSIAGGEDQASAVRVQTDGKIVLAGRGQIGSATDFALVRYNSDGSLDNTFGSFGRVATDFGTGTGAEALAMVIQPDGKLIAAGVVSSNSVNYVGLARYLTDGTLDGSFGTGGKMVTQVGLEDDYGTALVLEPDGKIVVAGASQQGANDAYAILRYNPDGSLDNSYGFGGKVVVSFNDAGSDFGAAVALDQIGRAVVVGNAYNLFGVARLTSEPFLKITSINHLANGQVALQGLGVPEANHTLWAAPDLIPGGFSPLDSVTPDAGGFWQYEDTNAVGLDRRFYRLSYP